MQKYLALLRGINVGGNKKVDMKKLKVMFEGLNFDNVSTYINSGNILFSSKEKDIKKLTEIMEKEFEKVFKFEVKFLLRDSEKILNLCKSLPEDFTNDKNQKTDILFLWEEYDKKSSLNLIEINKDVDNLIYVKGAIIWNLNKMDYSKSRMHKFIGTIVYKNMTARNVNTVRKLNELLKNNR